MLRDTVVSILKDSAQLHAALVNNDVIVDQLINSAKNAAESIKLGGKVLFAGNGGSFADAQHLAAEFIGSMGRERPSIPSIALGTNSSAMSAVSNDYGYEDVFYRELSAIVKKEDFVVLLSTSGNSKNLIRANELLIDRGVKSLALLGGEGGNMKNSMPSIVIPHSRTERIQECHILLGHIFCGLVEDSLGIFDNES